VDVSHHRVFEWSAPIDDWRVLADAAEIDDEAFAAPLPVAALVHAAKADDAMATALLAKGNRVLIDAHERARSEGLERGRQQGRRDMAESALFAILRSRDIAWSDADHLRIANADVPTLEIWIGRAATADTITDVFAA
jgi:hypothetical protein